MEKYNTKVSNIIHATATDIIGKKSTIRIRKAVPWLNEECREVIQGRKIAFRKVNSYFLYKDLVKCKRAQAIVRKTIKGLIGLITDNDETAYREEVSTLTKWCQENHLSLNIDKTKELVVDFRRQSREHTPIIINKTPVERVNSFKFLGVHITEDLTWSAHTVAVLKKAHQRLFFLRRLRKFGMSPSILRSFYTCTVESILTGWITAWFGNSIAKLCKGSCELATTLLEVS